jgi:cysteine desulfurase
MRDEFGNAGSRTHEYGIRAKRAVEKSRSQIAVVVDGQPDEVVFTSGATESNNLAILGLSAHGKRTGLTHIVSTAIEHKAVLEPLEQLQERGFEVTLVKPNEGGWIDPAEMIAAVRDNTLLVSMMHVNNETGVVQSIGELADLLANHNAYFHIDAAQGFGKDLSPLKHPRIDLISVSGHKICAPKGVGSLIARRRRYARPPLAPLMFGGGQERGLRPGTLAVPLIAGIGLAAELAVSEFDDRREKCIRTKSALLEALAALPIHFNGDQARVLPSVCNFSVEGLDSEAAMIALRDIVAISNGSACTAESYEPSHVLVAMGRSAERAGGAQRWSWCHLTPAADLTTAVQRLSD